MRERVAGGRQHRRVVRVAPEEDAQLLALAGGDERKIAGLLIESALARGGRTASEVAQVKMELYAIRHELARAVVAGTLPREEAREIAERIDGALDRLAAQ